MGFHTIWDTWLTKRVQDSTVRETCLRDLTSVTRNRLGSGGGGGKRVSDHGPGLGPRLLRGVHNGGTAGLMAQHGSDHLATGRQVSQRHLIVHCTLGQGS